MLGRCLLVLGFVAVAAWAVGCSKHATESTTAVQVTEHKIAPDEIGKDYVCPVMGTKTKVTAETPSLQYKGNVYYFCCPDCPPKFKADPEKYVGKAAPAGAETK